MRVRIILPCFNSSNKATSALPLLETPPRRNLGRRSSSSNAAGHYLVIIMIFGSLAFVFTTFLVAALDRGIEEPVVNRRYLEFVTGWLHDEGEKEQGDNDGGGNNLLIKDLVLIEDDESQQRNESLLVNNQAEVVPIPVREEDSDVNLEAKPMEDEEKIEDKSEKKELGLEDLEPAEEEDGNDNNQAIPIPNLEELLRVEKEIQPSQEEEEKEEDMEKKSDPQHSSAESLDLKKIHTCLYGEKKGKILVSTWLYRFKKSQVGADETVKTPSASRLSMLQSAITAASKNDFNKAWALANAAGYTVCKMELEKDRNVVIAWQPRTKGDVLFFTRHGFDTDIADFVVELPHAVYDQSFQAGFSLFVETNARAFLASTSHPCAKSLSNKCTGNLKEAIRSNCAGRTVFHNSDSAHSVLSFFHATHTQLSQDFSSCVVLSLLVSNTIDAFVLSDGTSNSVAPLKSNVAVSFARELGGKMKGRKTRVELCNKRETKEEEEIKDVSDAHSHLCGATNVQGRSLNGASDACKSLISRDGKELKSSNRFIHLEAPHVYLSKTAMSRPPIELVEAIRSVLREKTLKE